MKRIPQLSADDQQRFWSNVNKNCDRVPALENPDLYSHVVGNCWEWTGASSRDYGQFSFGGNQYRATRVAASLYTKKDISNLWVCHHCDNTWCVREEHIYLGTPKENTADMVSRGRFRLRAPSADFDGVLDKRYSLSKEEVEAIYYRYWTEEGLSQLDLAKEYNTTQSNIGLIVRGDNWTDVVNNVKLPYKLNKDCIKDKLTEEDVREMFRLYNSREMTRSQIAENFNLAVSSLDQIIRGEKWKHLDLAKTRKKIASEPLSPELVVEIYTRYWTDKSLSQSKMCKFYGVSQGTISHICSGKCWSEITSVIDLPNRIERTNGILTDEQIVEIYKRCHSEKISYAALGRQYGVIGDRVSEIARGLARRDLTESIAI